MKRAFSINILAAGSLLASACASVGPDYRPPDAAQLAVPPSYEAAPAAVSPADLQLWWKQLGDPFLDRLVEQAIAGNLDLAVARSRLRQAREAVVQARSDGLPTVGASAGAGRTLASNQRDSNDFSLGGDASWEADLFGGIRRSVEAARADAEASGYDLAAVRVTLIGEVVDSYVQARLAQRREALAREQLAMADDNLEIARWRLQAGLVSSIDVEQARGQRAQTAASIPTYRRSFSGAAYRLGVLTGQAPGALVAQLDAPQPMPLAGADVAAGIPADALRQRPDVRSAERSLAAQTARIGVAQAQLYPRLRLSGNIGTSALSVGNLFDAVTGNVFASLAQTLFDGGRLRSQVRSQRAAAEGAFATYKQTVLTALEDVENGLVAFDTAERREREFRVALDAARNQALLARSQYRAGLSDFQTLLEAERALNSANDGLVTSQADRTLAFVQLYRALGGGWDPIAPATDLRP